MAMRTSARMTAVKTRNKVQEGDLVYNDEVKVHRVRATQQLGLNKLISVHFTKTFKRNKKTRETYVLG